MGSQDKTRTGRTQDIGSNTVVEMAHKLQEQQHAFHKTVLEAKIANKNWLPLSPSKINKNPSFPHTFEPCYKNRSPNHLLLILL